MFIGGLGGMKVEVGSGEGKGFGGEPVDEVCGGVKCLDPVDRRKARLKQERTQNVINGTNRPFSLAILLGCIRTRHVKGDTVGEKERVGQGIIKLAAVVALNVLDGGAKLCVNIGKKN
jgi:hypothetical protein